MYSKKFKKGFVQPVLMAAMGLVGATSMGTAGFTAEAIAPNMEMVEQIQQEKVAQDLANGIVDGLTQKERAAKINEYYGRHNLPLTGHGMTFVVEADKYGLDWRLVAAIGMRESTGCKFAFAANNCFGWGKKVKFATKDVAIAEITAHLAGQKESTAYHYAGKDTRGILAKYNSVIPTYTQEIFAIMEDIESMEIQKPTLLAFDSE